MYQFLLARNMISDKSNHVSAKLKLKITLGPRRWPARISTTIDPPLRDGLLLVLITPILLLQDQSSTGSSGTGCTTLSLHVQPRIGSVQFSISTQIAHECLTAVGFAHTTDVLVVIASSSSALKAQDARLRVACFTLVSTLFFAFPFNVPTCPDSWLRRLKVTTRASMLYHSGRAQFHLSNIALC